MITKTILELSISVSSGVTPLRSNSDFWRQGTIPWLKTEQLGDAKYIYTTNEHTTEEALKQTSLKLNGCGFFELTSTYP